MEELPVKKTLMIALIALALLLGAAAFAQAASQTYPGSGSPYSTATGSVTVTTTVNPKINLTIVTPDATQTVNFGAIDPGVTTGIKTVSLSVSSNRNFTMTKATTGQSAQLGLATSLASGATGVKGAASPFTDNYTATPPFTTDPGIYNAAVQYTVTQN
jgi:hypothetical protein